MMCPSIELLDHQNDALAERGPDKRQVDEALILESIADKQRRRRLVESNGSIELCLASNLEPIAVFGCFLEVSLDHLPALVDLHRKHREVLSLVSEFLHRANEGLIHLADLAGKYLGEAEKHRRLDPAGDKLIDEELDIYTVLIAFGRVSNKVAPTIDAEVSGTPVFDSIGLSHLGNS
jgi:hypothetical protein